tara:strand:- start:568 stop:681 length:114 start_codon:yes stop_codon:yes gene_type:complete
MERLDRFFDVYERVFPPWFGEAAVAVVLFSMLAIFFI